MSLSEMVSEMKKAGLVISGAVAGVMLSFDLSAFADDAAKQALPIAELNKLSQTFDVIKNNYVDPVKDDKLLEDAITGMVKELDPHSEYYNEKDLGQFKEDISGKFSGIGAEVQAGKGAILVVAPIEDTPAYKAGILAGDSIVKIDDAPVANLSGLSAGISKLRGKEGTPVKLTIVRQGESKPLVFNIIRAVIQSQSVKAKMIEPGYAWIRITSFQDPTLKEFVEQAQKMYAQGDVKGIVLDLRNNPGGSLPVSIGVASAFLPQNVTVVSAKGRIDSANRVYKNEPSSYATQGFQSDALKGLPAGMKNVPVVVLINGASASASEVVSGALQDNKRATIMGIQSFGKGSVQTLFPLDSQGKTAVKITIARYYTPSGKSIQARGVIPDVAVDENADGRNPLYTREADIQNHLSNDSGVAEEKPQDIWDKSIKQEDDPDAAAKKDAKPKKFGDDDDFMLQQAIKQLKGLPVQKAKDTTAK